MLAENNRQNTVYYSYLPTQWRMLSKHVMQVILLPLDATQRITYQAGQYVVIDWQQTHMPFSIANAPEAACTDGMHSPQTLQVELHIKQQPNNQPLKELLANIRRREPVRIIAVAGECRLPAAEQPLLLLAGGTGYAPCRALLQQLQQQGDQRAVRLCWFVSNKEEAYAIPQLEEFRQQLEHFDYLLQFSSEGLSASCPAETIDGSVAMACVDQACQQLTDDMQAIEFIAAGPYGLVAAIWQHLQQYAVRPEQFHTDMLSTQ